MQTTAGRLRLFLLCCIHCYQCNATLVNAAKFAPIVVIGCGLVLTEYPEA